MIPAYFDAKHALAFNHLGLVFDFFCYSQNFFPKTFGGKKDYHYLCTRIRERFK